MVGSVSVGEWFEVEWICRRVTPYWYYTILAINPKEKQEISRICYKSSTKNINGLILKFAINNRISRLFLVFSAVYCMYCAVQRLLTRIINLRWKLPCQWKLTRFSCELLSDQYVHSEWSDNLLCTSALCSVWAGKLALTILRGILRYL